MKDKQYDKVFVFHGYSFEEAVGSADPLNDAVGRIAMNFGELEEVLSSCINHLLGTEPEIGLIITSEMSFKAKVHVLASLVKKEYEINELKISHSDFKDLLYMCTKSEELRNKLLHSSWIYDHSKSHVEIRRRKTSAKMKHGYKQDEEPLTPGQVLEMADYIITTAMYLEDFFIGCYDNYECLLESVIHA
ncbi:hypothetical protein [Candidatus Thiodiazotropha sp. LNASS1]|uniref:hypothetical protein n=1 Tax=Candidatus Thiodiazotropha sp. LNASS1 TaxID=3096260 RepID=UPI0034DF10C4